MKQKLRLVSASLVALSLAAATLTAAEAQNKPAKTAAPKPRTRPAPPKKPAKTDAGAPAPSADTPPAPAAAKPETAPAASSPSDAGVTEAKTLDGGARVFRFGEIEIEGRLRNPQLVYFLRRVRAEFAAGDLGHRSFMRELSETRRDPNF